MVSSLLLINDEVSDFTAISDQYDSNESTGFGDLAVGDVIVYNENRCRFELWFDASKPVSVVHLAVLLVMFKKKKKFYGYFWKRRGVGYSR